VVLLFSFSAAPAAEARPLSKSRLGASRRDGALIAAVNSVRAANLLPKLRLDARLARAARAHSLDMLRRDYFGHGNFGARMLLFHVRGHVFEENLAWSAGVPSARTTVASWLASPPHRAALLNPSVHRIGVAAPVGAFGDVPTATLTTADFAG
jgi:uncharacterized protein YkwD